MRADASAGWAGLGWVGGRQTAVGIEGGVRQKSQHGADNHVRNGETSPKLQRDGGGGYF